MLYTRDLIPSILKREGEADAGSSTGDPESAMLRVVSCLGRTHTTRFDLRKIPRGPKCIKDRACREARAGESHREVKGAEGPTGEMEGPGVRVSISISCE